jgi:putative heme transporter
VVNEMASPVEVLPIPGMMSPERDGEGIVCAHRAGILDGEPRETDSASVSGRQRNRIRVALGLLGAGVVVTFTVARRAALVESIAVLGHLRWVWLPVALGLEWLSMSTFARMQRQLLSAGGATVEAGSMLATAYGANALSTSIPLAGPELGAAFTFGRFRRNGVDSPLAGWSLIVGGVLSPLAGVLVLVGGALLWGNDLLAIVGVLGGLLGVASVAVLHTAARHSQVRARLVPSAAWALGRGRRLLRRSVGNPSEEIQAWVDRLASLHPGLSVWMGASSLALANWLTDAGVFAASIYAVGAPVPWRALLLVYGSGAVVRSLGITPGGLGLVEGTLCLGLVGAGLHSGPALASVLLYRLISFWMVAAAGWVVLLFLRGERRVGGSIFQKTAAT